MTRTFSFCSNKGGVGKSTLSTNLAAAYALAHPEETVLYCDLTFTESISNLLCGETKQASMMGVIHMMSGIRRRRESAKKFAWVAIPVFAGVVYILPLAPAILFLIAFVVMVYAYVFKYVLQRVDPLAASCTSSLAKNLHVLVGGETLAAASKEFPWETAVKEWNVPSSVDVVIFDLDNVLDEYARFALMVSNHVIIPSSLNLKDFKRLCVDYRNNSIFDFLNGLPAKQRPTVKGVIFNRVKCFKEETDDDQGEFQITASDASLRDQLIGLFGAKTPVHTFSLMRELPPSTIFAMLDASKPIPMLPSNKAYDSAKENLKRLANNLLA
jgi:cellulose biosynthesis protein BcsQ